MSLLYTAWDVIHLLRAGVTNETVVGMSESEVAYFLPAAIDHISQNTAQGMGNAEVELLGAVTDYSGVKYYFIIVQASKMTFALMLNTSKKICGRAALPSAEKWMVDALRDLKKSTVREKAVGQTDNTPNETSVHSTNVPI